MAVILQFPTPDSIDLGRLFDEFALAGFDPALKACVKKRFIGFVENKRKRPALPPIQFELPPETTKEQVQAISEAIKRRDDAYRELVTELNLDVIRAQLEMCRCELAKR
jgi:hypothetical protein